jgi:hypothetical protein
MTLLSVVKDVCAAVGVLIPQSVFSNIAGNRTMQEMLSLADEMAQRIAYDTRDWTLFKKALRCVGGSGLALDPADPLTVGCSVFDLPANYKRMLLTSNVWRSTNTMTPMKFVPDADEWLQRRNRVLYDAYGEWTIVGGRILFAPELTTGITATFNYLDKNCIDLHSGGRGDVFMDDLDAFALDERVLKLGMIWQWKAQKGSAYAEDMGTYGDALTYVMGHDQPAPIILGSRPISASNKVAYPWSVPT